MKYELKYNTWARMVKERYAVQRAKLKGIDTQYNDKGLRVQNRG